MKVDWLESLELPSLSPPLTESGPQCVATIGGFDGVHRGHQYLLRQAVHQARERDLETLVVTFDPLPVEVLHPDVPPGRLTDIEERLRLLNKVGIDRVAVLSFTRRLSRLQPAEFLKALMRRYRIQALWVGEDFAFGRDRQGDIAFLKRVAPDFGFDLRVIPRVGAEGLDAAYPEPSLPDGIERPMLPGSPSGGVSSREIRRLLLEGCVSEASHLLGHLPSVTGIVIHGAARGKQLGYPTANLDVPAFMVIPKAGIYAGYARLGHRHLAAAMSVGYNPTFGDNPLSMEAHILDFDQDIFGERLTLQFVERLRDELRFDTVGPLVKQMNDDVILTRRVLAGAGHREVVPR